MCLKIGISRCLLGERVRYDGGERGEPVLVEAMQRAARLVPLCPEVECGMSIPREPAEIGGSVFCPTFVGLRTGRNYTVQLMEWVLPRIERFVREPVHGMVLKSNSPSCACVTPKPIWHPENTPGMGWSLGLFARAFQERFPRIPMADEVVLQHPGNRNIFLERVRKYAASVAEEA
ncbi:Uncharacterized conserved protein YbbK, DUF523 family [Paucidesulfovibrio gracilis DSM 16080]|uniref:Uncharacterized conserved protein YbbK, DUF523 family n=1 Tax=Paucidesulfovibrio gracilis DSM 16080 TaxID=1121449 RepID=A0A1T4WTD9_9BACT|nr:DUF523 domain-containing protein [Paucidesulfovibrio gracilis]SKA79871.1 Uncharacterized conserved protein YbbK, DUF523 family [Paucidesulfovibrio gracilis DSM 16080]